MMDDMHKGAKRGHTQSLSEARTHWDWVLKKTRQSSTWTLVKAPIVGEGLCYGNHCHMEEKTAIAE